MSRRPSPPAASGVRAPWTSVPEHLRERVVEIAGGGEVVEAAQQTGGFSPGPAVRLKLSTGRRVFVKAVGEELNPDTPTLHRREARIAAAIPAAAPVPRLLGALDEDGWVALVFEDVDGRQPDADWDPAELRRVVDALAELSKRLDPSPIDAPSAPERLGEMFLGWQRLRAVRDEDGGDLAWLDPWALRHLDALIELETRAPEAAAGTALNNMDVRADNLLLTEDRVFVVDWPWATVGAPWLDLVLFTPSVWMHGGPELARAVYEHPIIAEADQDRVTAVVAAFAGMFLYRCQTPPPQGIPTLRPFQRAAGEATLEWAKSRLLLD